MSGQGDLGERAINAAQKIIKRGQDMARRETQVIKIQTALSRLQGQRHRVTQQMGEKVYQLFERDLVRNQDLRLMCQQIRGIEAEMDLKREEMEQLRRTGGETEEAGVDAEPPIRADLDNTDPGDVI